MLYNFHEFSHPEYQSCPVPVGAVEVATPQ